MAKIVDPDQLNQGTEVTFDESTKTIDLALAGNLDDDAPGKSSVSPAKPSTHSPKKSG